MRYDSLYETLQTSEPCTFSIAQRCSDLFLEIRCSIQGYITLKGYSKTTADVLRPQFRFNLWLLSPQALKAKTRGGTLAFRGCIHTMTKKTKRRNVFVGWRSILDLAKLDTNGGPE